MAGQSQPKLTSSNKSETAVQKTSRGKPHRKVSKLKSKFNLILG